MKKRYAAITAAVLLAVGILFFRDGLMVRLFPRMVLTKAVTASFDKLEERFSESPVHILARGLDPALCQEISMALNTETKLAGAVRYDMTLNTQTCPNRISGSGTVTYGGRTIDLGLYLDAEFGAVSSQAITGGRAYGLTYDAFVQDIRSHTLLALLIPENVVSRWDASLHKFAEAMGRSYTLPQLDADDLRTAVYGALALKPQVAAGERKHSHQVSFRAAGTQITEIADKYRDQIPEKLLPMVELLGEGGELEVVFLLQKRELTGIRMVLRSAEAVYQADAELSADQITLEFSDGTDSTGISVRTQPDGETYEETIRLTRNGMRTISLDYVRDLSTGEIQMELTKDGKQYAFRLNLHGDVESFTIHTQDFAQILSLISGKENTGPAICTLTVTKGGPVEPLTQVKNLSEWSLDDFWNLMSSLGALVGLKLT